MSYNKLNVPQSQLLQRLKYFDALPNVPEEKEDKGWSVRICAEQADCLAVERWRRRQDCLFRFFAALWQTESDD